MVISYIKLQYFCRQRDLKCAASIQANQSEPMQSRRHLTPRRESCVVPGAPRSNYPAGFAPSVRAEKCNRTSILLGLRRRVMWVHGWALATLVVGSSGDHSLLFSLACRFLSPKPMTVKSPPMNSPKEQGIGEARTTAIVPVERQQETGREHDDPAHRPTSTGRFA
jgi:hypothetical protein